MFAVFNLGCGLHELPTFASKIEHIVYKGSGNEYIDLVKVLYCKLVKQQASTRFLT